MAIQPRKIKKYGWSPDLPDLRDRTYGAAKPQKLPDKTDLSARFQAVRDQDQSGCCTGFGLTGAYGFLHPNFVGSPLQLYYDERAIEKTTNTDSGAQIRDGIKVLHQIGLAPEKLWPYDETKLFTAPPADVMVEAAKHKISSYMRLKGRDEFRTCLAEGFPFVLGISVYESFESEATAENGVVMMPQVDDQLIGGHCICIVGYDTHHKVGTNGVGDYYKFRNSWGADWGNHGYGWLPAAYVENQNLADDAWTIRV
jgi:C1A family cysteine protease